MYYVVQIDKRGRIIIPREIRRKIGIKPMDKMVVRIRSDGVIEVFPFDRLYREVSRVFEEKFRGWREESHEATEVLRGMVK